MINSKPASSAVGDGWDAAKQLTKVRLGFDPQRDFARQLQISPLCEILCSP